MITRKDVFAEIKSPKDFEKEPITLNWVYKAVYMVIRLLLDVRSNQVRIAKHLNIDLGESKTKDGIKNETA